MRPALRLVLTLSTTLAVSACAQRGNSSPAPAARWNAAANLKPADSTCEQILARARSSTDNYGVYLWIAGASVDDSSIAFQRRALRGILTHLRLPDTVRADFALKPDTIAWPRDSALKPPRKGRLEKRDPPLGDRGEFDALVNFSVGRDGAIHALSVRFPSPLPALHSAFMAAVNRADSARAIPAIPTHLAAPQDLQLRIVVRRQPQDSTRPVAHVPIRFPTYTKEASPFKVPTPAYPRELMSAGIEGEVKVGFVINADGSVREGSTRILGTARHEFVQAVQRTLRGAFYHPAEYRGCPIAEQVVQPYLFSQGR